MQTRVLTLASDPPSLRSSEVLVFGGWRGEELGDLYALKFGALEVEPEAGSYYVPFVSASRSQVAEPPGLFSAQCSM